MSSNIRLDARAALSTYVIFGFFVLPGCGVMLLDRRIQTTICFSAILILIFAWVRRFRIVVDETSLSYTSLFGGKKIVKLDDITTAHTEIGSKDRFGPVMRFELECKPPSREHQIVINMKVFSRKDLHSLFEILHDKMAKPPRISIFGRE